MLTHLSIILQGYSPSHGLKLHAQGQLQWKKITTIQNSHSTILK